MSEATPEQKPEDIPLSIPNHITLARIMLIPVFVVIVYLPFKWSYTLAACIFAIAGISDIVDGYLARKLGQTSRLGAFLDPVADKLMVAVALMLLVEIHATVWLAIPAIVIVCREIAVSALREWMAEIGKRANVAVSVIGKVKTVVQIVAITALLAFKPEFSVDGKLIMEPFLIFGYICLYTAMAFTIWSGLIYLQAAWPDLMANKGE